MKRSPAVSPQWPCRASKQRFVQTALVVSFVLLFGACSTLPKKDQAVNERKNEAAGYLKLADNFMSQNQYASALQFYDQALRTNLAVDYIEGAITARSSLGRVYLRLQAWEDADRELSDALLDAQALNNPSLLALCLNNLGEYHHLRNDTKRAEETFKQAAQLAANAKDAKLLALIAHNQGVVALRLEQVSVAIAAFEQARAANEKAGRWSEYAANCYMLASIENRKGNIPLALEWANKALEADKRAENSIGIAADLEALAHLHRKAGQRELAFDHFRRAFQLSLQLNDFSMAERCLEALITLSEELDLPAYAERYRLLRQRLRNSS